jgi:aspartate/methionine/tyrosine aminotransferase
MDKPVSPIAPFQLERYFARWEFTAPYLLCTSDIQGYPLKDLLALADDETRELWDALTLGYTESLGHPLLREEIARMYEATRAEDILCFAGAEEAIYITQRVLLRERDHMIVTFPGYQSSYQIAESIGTQVSRWMLRPVRGADGRVQWVADPDELRRLVRPNTRLILVNFPHNPTGALPSQAEWQAVVQVAREANCYLFSDEVYRMMEYETADRLSAAADQYDQAISLGVMSKPFGLAGLRIGWLALRDPHLRAQIASYKDYTTICNSAPAEILSIIALRAKEEVLRRSLALIQANRALVENTFSELADLFEWIPPQAGSIAFPRWLGKEPVEEFTNALVQAEGVLLLPGTVYNYPENHFRLGLGRENVPEALERLKRFCWGLKTGKLPIHA